MIGGELLADGPPFENSGAERDGWNKFRAELMATSYGAGMIRPVAYFRWDLGIVDRVVHRWHDQLAVLLDRNLISAEEAERIDHAFSQLHPKQSLAYGSSFERPNAIRSLQLSRYLLSDSAQEFDFAARWHVWRGRPELAERYHLRASTVRAVLQEGRL